MAAYQPDDMVLCEAVILMGLEGQIISLRYAEAKPLADLGKLRIQSKTGETVKQPDPVWPDPVMRPNLSEQLSG